MSCINKVWLADDHSVPVEGEGDIWVKGKGGCVCVRDVLFAPQLSAPLFSVSKVYDSGGKVLFHAEDVKLYCARHNEPCLTGERLGNGWYVPIHVVVSSSHKVSSPTSLQGLSSRREGSPEPCVAVVRGCDTSKATGSWRVWHARLAHLGWQQLKRLMNQKLAFGVDVTGIFPSDHACDACLEGKMQQYPFTPASSRSSTPFELVSTDLVGPIDKRSIAGHHKYILVLVDDFTRYGWVYFLRKKSQAPERVKNFIRLVERQFRTKVAKVRSDRGGEFLANRLTSWFDKHGIMHDLSLPDTPQQNGVAERYNRTLQERARSMLCASGLPSQFWEHAVRYACWLSNRVPSSGVADYGTPYAALRGKTPTLAMAKVFGCLAQVWVDPATHRKSQKFASRAQWAVFLGVSSQSKAWEFYLPASKEVGHLSRNAFFYEDQFLKDWKAKEGENHQVNLESRDLGEHSLPPAPNEFVAPLLLPPRAPAVSRDSRGPEAVIQSEVRPDQPALSLDAVELDVGPEADAQSPAFSGEGESLRDVDDTQSEGAPQEGESLGESMDPSAEDSGSKPLSSTELIEEPVRRWPVRERRPIQRYNPTPAAPLRMAAPVAHSQDEDDLPGITPGPKGVRPLSGLTGAQGKVVRASPSITNALLALPVSRKPAVIRTCAASGGETWKKGLGHHACAHVTVGTPKWDVPTNLKQADASIFADQWREARQVELDRLEEMGTWDLVDPPPGANILGCKWVFAVKTKLDGTVDRFKSRLVVQGYGQKEGVDYGDTYANTAGKTTVRLFLALVCCLGLRVKQMDVTTAFLYGNVDKDIYMRQPLGHSDGSGRVCKLKRALYGLKQAPRIWEETLRSSLLAMGFKSSSLDPCLYIMQKDGETLFLLDFVDDMLLASHSQSLIDWVAGELCKEYAMTDMGDARKYVGLSIVHDREAGEMWVHQSPYITSMAEKFGISSKTYPDTPLPYDFVLEHPWELAEQDPPPSCEGKSDPLLTLEQVKRYQQIVGSLNYAAHSTRLDVAYAVNQLSRATRAPRMRHMAAAERCVLYLLGTANLGLHFRKHVGMNLECFVDANYSAGGGKKSISGFILSVGGAPVHWTSRKQDRVTTSTCDAESYATMAAVQYLEFVRDLLAELGCMQMTPTPVYNDNTATIRLCIDPVAHKKSVQLTRPMAYVRERTLFGVIAPLHIGTHDQPADFLTKRLDGPPYLRCRELSGLHSLPP